jgi:ABC-type uncharacterized transport system permease subunit
MLKNLFFLVVIASACVFTPHLTFAANANKTKILTKEFNAKETFSLHSSDLRTLMLALYECQPQALQKSTKVSKEEFVQWVFEGPFGWQFDAIKNTKSIEALKLSFSQEYQGDRVLPLITGLYTMLLQAYGGKNEYTFEAANPQKLTIATQNIDISAAKLLSAEQEKSVAEVNENCRTNIKQILNRIAQRTEADARGISSYTPTGNRLNPFQMDANTLEFIPL